MFYADTHTHLSAKQTDITYMQLTLYNAVRVKEMASDAVGCQAKEMCWNAGRNCNRFIRYRELIQPIRFTRAIDIL